MDALPEEASINADLMCANVTSFQPTTSAFDSVRSTEANEHVDRGVPIPYGSPVLHATPVAMSDATRGIVLPLQAATSGNIKLIYKYPGVLNEQGGGHFEHT